jgi:hypothetical protein
MISIVEINESTNQSERLQPDRQCEGGRLPYRYASVHRLVCLVAAISLSDLVEQRGPDGERNEHPFHFVLNDEANPDDDSSVE